MPRYRIDFHGHCQGDPMDTYIHHSIYEHIDRAVEVGLEAIAITWHGKVFRDARAQDYAKERGIVLIPGIEANLFGKCHTLILNVKPGQVEASTTLADLKRLRDNPEILVVAPHPYYPHWSCLRRTIDEHPDLFDGAEWCHLHVRGIPAKICPNRRAAGWAQRYGKPVMAFTDAHELAELGTSFTEIEAAELSIPAVFQAVRDGRVKFEERFIALPTLVRKVTEVLFGPEHLHAIRFPSQKRGTSASSSSAAEPAAAP